MTTIKPTLELAARADVAAWTEARFRASDAIREVDGVVEIDAAAVLGDPAAVHDLVALLAARIGQTPIDVVIGPSASAEGAVLARATARHLQARSVAFDEDGVLDGPIGVDARVVLVDGILAEGGGWFPGAAAAVEARGGGIVACLGLVDPTRGRPILTSATTGRTYPRSALWRPDVPDLAFAAASRGR